ncbi:membrane dipeptidase [Tateyamaria sp. ANG-S1]|uniref:dipeptidase n=1 Tax=Tateyamaria sp. ANG-S1 TaxID=1577905 RepID=UPI00057CBD4D|nr:membrane dipeptidase [Tateyamaria sp. ANG-S1]KIC46162.1 peptidase M19 [Tateyamaria sp. ANG-S1]
MRWIKRGLIGLGIVLAAAIAAFLTFAPGYVEKGRNAVVPHDPYPVSDTAQSLHDTLVVGDWHADSLLWKRSIEHRADRGHVDIPRLIEGGVALQVFAAVTKSPAGQNYEANSAETFDNITPLAIGQMWPPRTWGSLAERAIYQAERLHKVAARVPDRLTVITSQAELDAHLTARANGSKAVGGLLGIEGAHALEGDMANLDRIEAAGHRIIGLQHFFDNELGGSLHGTRDMGLTDFGRAVVAEIEARGMVLDLAHASPAVARDAIAMTDMPVIVSHTGLHGFCPVTRNFEDDLMQAVASTGGVIGLGYWGDILCRDATPEAIAAMIVQAIDTVGADHVSLGSDFDGSVTTAFDTSKLASLTHALIDAGLDEPTIAKVMGGNMVRVLRARLN